MLAAHSAAALRCLQTRIRVGEAQAVVVVEGAVLGNHSSLVASHQEVAALDLLQGTNISHLHNMKIAHRDELILLALGQCGRVGRRLADAEVVNPSVAYLPALVLCGVGRGDVIVLDDHLVGQQIDLVAEVAVLGVVDPEHTAHSDVLEVAQTEVVYPEILLKEGREGDTILRNISGRTYDAKLAWATAIFCCV